MYFIAIVFLVLWAISFFFYMAGAIVHVLLLVAIIAIGIKIYNIKQKRKEKLRKDQIKKASDRSFMMLFFAFFLVFKSFSQELTLTKYIEGFQNPLGITHAGDDRMFIIEQAGTIQIVKSGQKNEDAFLNISEKVTSGGEQGLLGLAFHPNYSENGFFYINYINKEGNTIIARYSRTTDDADKADENSEKILMEIDQPYENHNGGALVFGPDGFLYISLGDGGSAGDPEHRAQNLNELLGKILRVDVNGDPYAIPADNPFVGNENAKPEIWAYGLRNPWRISFDRQTNDLYIADVGQSKIEEINFQQAGSTGGKNFGWRCYEGTEPYNTSDCPDVNEMVFPVFEYNHDNGHCSVTGGYVYRGSKHPDLQGKYIFADFCSGSFWTLSQQDGQWQGKVTADFNDMSITAFGESSTGELYAAAFENGTIYEVGSSATSIQEKTSKNIKVFPNPFNGFLTVTSEKETILGITLQNMEGASILSKKINNLQTSLDLSLLPKSCYILSIYTDIGDFHYKICK